MRIRGRFKTAAPRPTQPMRRVVALDQRRIVLDCGHWLGARPHVTWEKVEGKRAHCFRCNRGEAPLAEGVEIAARAILEEGR